LKALDLRYPPPKLGGYSGAAEIMAVGLMLISHDLPSKNLVGGAITILKNMSSSMGRMTSHI